MPNPGVSRAPDSLLCRTPDFLLSDSLLTDKTPEVLMNSNNSTHRTGGRNRVVRTRRRRDLGGATLGEADRRLLAVLCAHRVVRQDQLERLLPDIPQRTLRYRTRRLHDLGLMGRTRPYRERGSAPNHHWPTRRADCMMNGDPIPRGGEREQPNPLFLAHAAALTELYVTLTAEGPNAGLSLFDYRREADAREPFKHLGKQRALAPDAMVILIDKRERKLGAFVEIDLGHDVPRPPTPEGRPLCGLHGR